MNAHFSKWGNSIALRIPNGVVRELHVADGNPAELHVRDGSLIVTPLGRPKYDLAEMIAAITPDNMHGAVDSGDPIGNEAL